MQCIVNRGLYSVRRIMISENFFVMLNTISSLVVIICSVLSFKLVESIAREFKGLKSVDIMWHYFMIMINLFVMLGILRAVLSIGSFMYEAFQPIYDALLSIILIFYFVFALLLSTSIEEIIE